LLFEKYRTTFLVTPSSKLKAMSTFAKQPEALNRKTADNAIVKWKRTTIHTIMNKTLHRKRKVEQNE
jgi:hypothetical protein